MRLHAVATWHKSGAWELTSCQPSASALRPSTTSSDGSRVVRRVPLMLNASNAQEEPVGPQNWDHSPATAVPSAKCDTAPPGIGYPVDMEYSGGELQ